MTDSWGKVVEPVHPAVSAYLAAMNLTREEAQEIRDGDGWACACMGPPEEIWSAPDAPYPAPCRCSLLMMRVDQLLGESNQHA